MNINDDFLLKEHKSPLTNGSLVKKSFISFLMQYYHEKVCTDRVLLTVHKWGLLNVSHPGYKKNLESYNKFFSNVQETLEKLKNNKNQSIKNIQI